MPGTTVYTFPSATFSFLDPSLPPNEWALFATIQYGQWTGPGCDTPSFPNLLNWDLDLRDTFSKVDLPPDQLGRNHRASGDPYPGIWSDWGIATTGGFIVDYFTQATHFPYGPALQVTAASQDPATPGFLCQYAQITPLYLGAAGGHQPEQIGCLSWFQTMYPVSGGFAWNFVPDWPRATSPIVMTMLLKTEGLDTGPRAYRWTGIMTMTFQAPYPACTISYAVTMIPVDYV